MLAFAAGLSAITAVAFGIGPALRATQTNLGPSLKAGAQKGDYARGASNALLTAQVAISLVLLVGAGLSRARSTTSAGSTSGSMPTTARVRQRDSGVAE